MTMMVVHNPLKRHFFLSISFYFLSFFFFPKDRTLSYCPPPKLEKRQAEVSCKIARLLISAGSDPNALNNSGQTPLMVAILQVKRTPTIMLRMMDSSFQ